MDVFPAEVGPWRRMGYFPPPPHTNGPVRGLGLLALLATMRGCLPVPSLPRSRRFGETTSCCALRSLVPPSVWQCREARLVPQTADRVAFLFVATSVHFAWSVGSGSLPTVCASVRCPEARRGPAPISAERLGLRLRLQRRKRRHEPSGSGFARQMGRANPDCPLTAGLRRRTVNCQLLTC